jgi:TfoX/Sxy family transcriptional regulator of competence genes
MAWIKIPAENHPLFHAALPRDPRISTLQMFGGVAAMVNGHMLGGLFGRGALVRLSAPDQKEALALDGAEPFDPMGKGHPMKDTVLLPESIMDEPEELKSWLRRALEYTAMLPAKKKGGSAKPAKRGGSATPAKRGGSAKPAKRGGSATAAKRGGSTTAAKRGGSATPAKRGGSAKPRR